MKSGLLAWEVEPTDRFLFRFQRIGSKTARSPRETKVWTVACAGPEVPGGGESGRA